MDGLRPRNREIFIGFTMAETETMDKLMRELGEQVLEREFCQSTAKSFNRSPARAGKPIVKWTEKKRSQTYQSWNLRQGHQKMGHGMMLKCSLLTDSLVRAKLLTGELETTWIWKTAHKNQTKPYISSLSDLCHLLKEVRVRFVGFGAEEDEWVNVKKAVRERSVPLEHSECRTLKVGDHVLCILERRDEAIYYDSHITDPKENARYKGAAGVFTIRYNPDNCEERVRLRRLCRRPKL